MERYYNTNTMRHSFKTLFSNKIRFFLTIIGIIVGVMLFTFTVLNFDNNYRMINKRYEQFGQDTVVLNGDFSSVDYINISQWEHVEDIVAYNQYIQAKPYKTDDYLFYMTGVGENYLQMPLPDINSTSYVYYSKLLYGRDFNNAEINGLVNAAMINETTSVLFFGSRSAVGETITLIINGKKINFTIVGIIQDSFTNLSQFDTLQGGLLNDATLVQNYDMNMYIPQAVYNKYAKENAIIEKIVITNSQLSLSDLNNFLFDYYGGAKLININNSSKIKQEQIDDLNDFKNLYFVLSCIFVVFSGLVLIVVMLFSIKERVYEIGLKKALGARNIDIVFQFVGEFIVLGFLGSILGVIFGVLSFCINCIFSNKGVLYFYVFPSIYAIITPFFVMMLFICVLAFIPAIIAGKVNIIEAIRFE